MHIKTLSLSQIIIKLKNKFRVKILHVDRNWAQKYTEVLKSKFTEATDSLADTNDLASNEPTKEFPNLYKQVVKGGFWVFALRIFTQGLGFLRLIILARLLNPEDFGLLGIALLLMSILETFTTTGFDAALVQKQEDIKPYLNVAWTINILRGFVLFIVAFLAAPIMAKIKVPSEQYELAKHIIQFISISFVFHGFTNVGTVYFTKEMLFHKRFIIQSVTSVVNLSITIAIAIIYRSVWALAIGKVLGSIFACIFSYYMHPFRPKLSLEFGKAKNLWNFGKWLTLNSILGFLMREGDDLLVWVLFGPKSLAFYQIAYKISNLPTQEITHVINKVTFPAYSLLQNDLLRLKKAFFKVIKKTMLVTIPISILIVTLSPYFVKFALGEKWLETIVLIQILTIRGFTTSIGASTGPLFISTKKVALMSKLVIFHFIIYLILMAICTPTLQMTGIAIAVAISSVIIQPVTFYKIYKNIFTKQGTI